MNELTDEDSMLEKAVLENEGFDLDTKLRIIRKIEESRTKGVSVPQYPFTYRDLEPTKITCKTN